MDFDNPKLKKFKDLLIYIKAKVEFEIYEKWIK